MGQGGTWWYSDIDGYRQGAPPKPPQRGQGRPHGQPGPPPPPSLQYEPQLPRYQPLTEPRHSQGPQYQPPVPRFSPQGPPPVPPRPAVAPGPAKKPAPKAKRSPKARGCLGLVVGVVGLFAWFLVSAYGGSGGKGTPAAVPATSSAAQAKAHAKAQAKTRSKVNAEVNACGNRPAAGGDFYLRVLSSGSPWTAQELGDEYSWDYATGKCLTGEQLMMASAPQGAGQCTQEGFVSENPGYDVNASPAPELPEIDNETGAAC